MTQIVRSRLRLLLQSFASGFHILQCYRRNIRPTPKTKTKAKTKKTKKQIDPDVANYLNQRKNKLNHRVGFFNSNDRLMDKEFFRTITCNEDDPDDDIDQCGYDYKINMVNVDGNPDLLKLIPPMKNDRYYYLKLHDIVDYLHP